MIQRLSTWSVLSRYVVAWVKVKNVLSLSLLCMGLLLSGCGGDVALAPVSKHAKGSRWSPGLHTVSQGETLYSIAFQYGQDYRTLAHRNGIRPPHTIYVGQKLKLRGGTSASSKLETKKPVTQPKPTKKTSKSARVETRPQKSVKSTKTSAPSPKQSGPLRWNWPTYGRVIENFSSKSSTQKGIEIAGRLGQGIKAAGAGRVVYSGSGLRGYGKLIIVKHNEQYLSAYAHNRKLLVKEGDTVTLGQRIAEMGRSGADRVKLHFEIRREGNPVDPMRYLPKRSS